MKIEIVEFYPIFIDDEKKRMTGSLHIYLIDLDIDIRGIYVIRNKSRILLHMPYKNVLDHETKQFVRFPIFSFTDNKKNISIKKEILKQAREYIIKNFVFSSALPELAVQ